MLSEHPIGGERLAALTRSLGSPVDAELVSLQADVRSLTGELLDRYEEITLLYDLAREMGVVVDIEGASRTALVRSLQVIPAQLGLVLVANQSEELTTVAAYGDAGPEDSRCRTARQGAAEALRTGSQVMANAGDPISPGGEPVTEPVLVAPLTVSGTVTTEAGLAGVLAFIGHAEADRFCAAEAQLCAVVAGQLGQGLENARVIRQLREKERLEGDLQVAAGIQRSLLPARPPRLLGAEFAAACVSAAHVGGDYYDFLSHADGAVSAVVADVTGHGLGPGLIMVMARSVLRAELLRSGCLSDALLATNSVMWEDLVATEAFITVFAVRYDPELRVLHFADAGHQPALLRHADGSIEELTCDGMPLGIVPSPPYELAGRVLDANDVVLIFSDGVVEASAPDGAAYGMSRLRSLMAGSGDISAPDLVARVLADVAEFQAAGVQDDDITVMALRVASDPGRFR